jgi:hypothetical protein
MPAANGNCYLFGHPQTAEVLHGTVEADGEPSLFHRQGENESLESQTRPRVSMAIRRTNARRKEAYDGTRATPVRPKIVKPVNQFTQ